MLKLGKLHGNTPWNDPNGMLHGNASNGMLHGNALGKAPWKASWGVLAEAPWEVLGMAP